MARRLEHWVAAFAAVLFGCLVPDVGSAQRITTDGSLGAKVTLSGPNYAITADLGRQVGGNLFHSFGAFGLNNGETATFNGPATVTNVIGRVTGGTASSINGKIDASGLSGANLYLINPAGIVFGPTATVNVSGSFHASTADYLRLSDGAKFQATNPSGSTLTAAAPAAFGFLTASPPAITVDGSQLGGAAGTTFGVVGGPITIKNAATLTAPAGTIHVTSVAGAGEVPVDPANSSAFTVTSLGPVSITGGAKLDVSDPKGLGSGGSVFVRAGKMTIDASRINGDNYGTGSGGKLYLYADNQITLTGGTNIQSLAQSSGAGAAIAVATALGGSITADDSTIKVGSLGAGAAGPLSVATGQISLTGGAGLVSSSAASGAGGSVTVVADTVAFDGGSALNPSTGIFTSTSSSVTGGSIAITAGRLTLQNGAGVLTQSTGSGAGGAIAVSVSDSATVDAGASLGTTTAGTGAAGKISVSVAGPLTIDMTLGNSASVLNGIGSLTTGAGDGGDVSVGVGGRLSIIGPGSTAEFNSGIQAATVAGSTGNAGNVTVAAGTLSIVKAGQLISPTYGLGNSGDVSVTVQGTATIDGSSQNPNFNTKIGSGPLSINSGHGGNVAVTAETLDIVNGGAIASGTRGPGHAGNISITVNGQLTVDTVATIFAGTAGTSSAGNVNIVAGSLSLTNSSSIDAATFAPGDAASVTVTAGTVSVSGGSQITTAANPGSTGNAGSIRVTADSLSITANGTITSSTSGPGNGGNVTANVAAGLTIDGAAGNPQEATILTAALPGATGNAGSVAISAGTLGIANGGKIVSTTFGAGNGGSVSATVVGALTIDGIPNAHQSVIGTGILTAALAAATGSAGSVKIAAGTLSITGNSGIGAWTYGRGNGGNVTIDVDGQMTLDGRGIGIGIGTAGTQSLTGISADALSATIGTDPNNFPGISGIITAAFPGSIGNAGDVAVTAGSLSIINDGLIFSPTFGPGNGGDIDVNVAGTLAITGTPQSGVSIPTEILPGATGNAGNMKIAASNMNITDGGSISSRALTANGGDITISVNHLLYLNHGEITTQVDASTGNGGNIAIDPTVVVLDSSKIIATASGSGLNGNITIRADAFIESADSIVTATGLVTFVNPPTNLSSALAVLSSELRSAPAVFRDTCAVRSARPRSTLTQAGRGGLPQDPEATIPALYLAGRDVEPSSPVAATEAPTLVPRQSSLRLTKNCGD